MKRLLNAVRFMTILPLPGPAHADLAEVGKSSAFFPVVGFLIGGILVLVAWLTGLVWGALSTAVIVTAVWVFLTAGLHLDGLADLADGIGGGWDVESRLRIMKDSAIGTYGALAIVVTLLLKTVLIHELFAAPAFESADGNGDVSVFVPAVTLFIVPAAARCVQVLSIRIFKPAKKEGFGQYFKNAVRTPDAAVAVVITLVAVSAFWSWAGVAITAAAVLCMLVCGRWISSRLGGLNGDSYGAVCELSEVFLLAAVSIVQPQFTGWLKWLNLF